MYRRTLQMARQASQKFLTSFYICHGTRTVKENEYSTRCRSQRATLEQKGLILMYGLNLKDSNSGHLALDIFASTVWDAKAFLLIEENWHFLDLPRMLTAWKRRCHT